MNFRTVIDIPASIYKIRHDRGVMLFGSCFSNNIGRRLEDSMFNVSVNPFGTLYNPSSIANAITRIVDRRYFMDEELIEHGGLWHSFYHHSRFSSSNKAAILHTINSGLEKAGEDILSAGTLIITFGTAFVFNYKKTGATVANCHKLPAAEFARERLSMADIMAVWQPLCTRLLGEYQEMNIIFTVSPIRHLADGAHGNQLSKAVLLDAVDRLVARFDRCRYFPAYEIVLDELRDYRFYAADMVHPSEVAADYVMQRFAETYYDEETAERAERCRKLHLMLNHRFLTDNESEIKKFKDATIRYANKLAAEMPYIRDTINRLILEKWNIQFMK